jgi:hypothetical protein
MNRRSHFQRGSGVYTCCECGKRTRETGDGESQGELCRRCWQYFGWENTHNDCNHEGSDDDPDKEHCPICQGLEPWEFKGDY